MNDYPSIIAFIVSVISLLVYIFFLVPRQFSETLRPKDWLTGLRFIILAILVVSIIGSIPPTLYQYYRMNGQDYQVLRSISTVTSSVSRLGTTALLVLLFTYRKKSDD